MKAQEKREKDPPHYQKIVDNMFPIQCPACEKDFGDDYMGMAKHYGTHYTRHTKH